MTLFVFCFHRTIRTCRLSNHPLLRTTPQQRRRLLRGKSEEEIVKKMMNPNPNPNPNVNKFQELLHSYVNSTDDGWEKCWERGLTPWDLKQTTPVLIHLLQNGSLPIGRTLIPGCGTGYDVVAIASPERYVIGLDISNSAIKKAQELSSSTANHFTFLKADFFTWQPSELFDLIFDYTFFCAIEPDVRPTWARRMNDLLKPSGELITLMFPIDDEIVGGPPYKVSVADYEVVLHPFGFRAISIEDNELAIGRRKGKEKLGRWKRSLNHSLL